LRPSNSFPLVAFLFIVGLLISMFILPSSYSYKETCPTCQGRQIVTCETCHSNGKCWICDGTGRIWYMPETDNWCAACRGTGRCYKCGGSGSCACGECVGTGILIYWMYTLTGSTIILSIISIFLFLGLFGLSYISSAFYLSFNEWVYKVEDMNFWFNPTFITWLFAKHPKRWAKWQTALNLIGSVFLGASLFGLASLKKITQETFLWGTLFSIAIVSSFSFFFYKSYISRLEAIPTA